MLRFKFLKKAHQLNRGFLSDAYPELDSSSPLIFSSFTPFPPLVISDNLPNRIWNVVFVATTTLTVKKNHWEKSTLKNFHVDIQNIYQDDCEMCARTFLWQLCNPHFHASHTNTLRSFFFPSPLKKIIISTFLSRDEKAPKYIVMY